LRLKARETITFAPAPVFHVKHLCGEAACLEHFVRRVFHVKHFNASGLLALKGRRERVSGIPLRRARSEIELDHRPEEGGGMHRQLK